MRFFLKFCYLNYFTDVESLTVSVAFSVEPTTSVVASDVAFSVAVFSPQDVIREIVVKKDNEIKTNFFILNKVIKGLL